MAGNNKTNIFMGYDWLESRGGQEMCMHRNRNRLNLDQAAILLSIVKVSFIEVESYIPYMGFK